MSHSVKLMQNSQAPVSNKGFLALLVLLILPISGLSIDIYVPSLPAVSRFFSADKALVQLTVTAYMLGLGLMQLFAGAISDSYGRRKPFLIALFLFIVATFCIPATHNIYQLLILRFIQGVTIAVAVVPLRSIISDLFEGKEFYKMVSYMTMAWSIGPIIAPAIGGYLQTYFGWQASFYFLVIYCSICLILNAIYLPETSIYRHSFHPRKIFKRSKNILSHKLFLSGLMINVMLYSLVILFTIVGPFLIQNVMHYSALQFGKIALLIGFAWFLGSMINRLFLHTKLETKRQVCLWAMLLLTLCVLIIECFMPITIYLVVIPVFILCLLGGITFPNHFARGMLLFPESTASANALFGGFLFLLTGITSALGAFLKASMLMPLTITYLILIIGCLLIHYLESSKHISS